VLLSRPTLRHFTVYIDIVLDRYGGLFSDKLRRLDLSGPYTLNGRFRLTSETLSLLLGVV
jgi:hypothetical protein